MNTRTLFSLIVAGAIATVAWSPAPPAVAAEEAAKAAQPAVKKKKKRNPAKRLYLRRTCMACHGKDGKRSIQDYPNLAGQDEKYMINQVRDILAKKRSASPDATGNPRTESMRGALVTPEGEHRITPEEVKTISKWLAKMEPAKPIAPEKPIPAENAAKGKKLYKKCRACHGKEGKKPLKSYPFIAGQKRAYIVNQITDIKNKVRKNGKTKAMYPFVKKLSEKDIGVLADYLSQIDRTKK